MRLATDCLQARLGAVTMMFLVSACVINRANEAQQPRTESEEAAAGVEDDGDDEGQVAAPASQAAVKAPVGVKVTEVVKGKTAAKTEAAAKAVPAPKTVAAKKAPAVTTKAAAAKGEAPATKPQVAAAKPKAAAKVAAAEPKAPAKAATAEPKTDVKVAAAEPKAGDKPVKHTPHRQKAATAASTKAAVSSPGAAHNLDAKVAKTNGEKFVRFVAAEMLNVRSSPRSDAPVVAKITRGSMFTVQLHGNWAKLSDGQFVLAKYLSRAQPAAKPESVASSH